MIQFLHNQVFRYFRERACVCVIHLSSVHGSSHYQFQIPSQWNLLQQRENLTSTTAQQHTWNPNDHPPELKFVHSGEISNITDL